MAERSCTPPERKTTADKLESGPFPKPVGDEGVPTIGNGGGDDVREWFSPSSDMRPGGNLEQLVVVHVDHRAEPGPHTPAIS